MNNIEIETHPISEWQERMFWMNRKDDDHIEKQINELLNREESLYNVSFAPQENDYLKESGEQEENK